MQGARVLYVDTDAHHGDGVQWIFYEDPGVLTISFHESGRYLFPGTGSPSERGDGAGFGYSVNVPLEPYTDHASFVECYGRRVPGRLPGARVGPWGDASPESLPTRMHNALDAIPPVPRQEIASQSNRDVANAVAERGLP